MNTNLVLNFQSPEPLLTLTFEDTGKVAYAYLKNDGKIVGDVWLYNHLSIDKPEWDNPNNAPFLNPTSYINPDGIIKKDITIHDVLVDWEKENNSYVAYIYIFEDLYGVIAEGDKPGYARYATVSNPIAKVMEIE